MNTSFGSLSPSSFGELALRGGGGDTSLSLDQWQSAEEAGTLHAQPGASARSLEDIERDFLAALCETRETRPA
jgi:hypothetical protein